MKNENEPVLNTLKLVRRALNCRFLYIFFAFKISRLNSRLLSPVWFGIVEVMVWKVADHSQKCNRWRVRPHKKDDLNCNVSVSYKNYESTVKIIDCHLLLYIFVLLLQAVPHK